MKGDYLESKSESAGGGGGGGSMFPKVHHPHPLHHTQHHPFSHHLHLDFQPSEDESAATSRPSPASAPEKPSHRPGDNAGDGATIEVVRRPRGRPPGSKNKSKPPVVIAREPEPVMSPYILEVPGGADVVEAISRFCRRKGTGLCVLTGSGTVANLTLRQPSAANAPPGATVTFHGRFEILSISATFLHQALPFPVPNGFSISLAGPQGQIVGGYVAGPLVAAGPVFVVAASFNNPSYHRLPDEREESRKSTSDGNSPPVSGEGDGRNPAHSQLQRADDSCGVPPGMYSCQMATDAMWAPPSKQQQQHY